jgi:glycosyltransferase involved in cell wall biosynthesis
VADAPTLIELAPFDRPAPGSFISALAALGEETRSRGWGCEIVVPESARELDWISRLEAAGMGVHFSLPRTWRERTRWLRELVAARGGTTIMHSHFTAWDVPAAIVAAPRRGLHAWWHIHTILGRGPLAFARNLARFAPLGRRIDGALCPVENIAADLRARGLPGRKVHVVPNGIDPAQFPVLDGETRRLARERLGLGAQDEVLLHFGWDWGIKGGDLFLATVATLLGAGRSRVVGLAQGDGESAMAAARRFGIEDRVRTVGTVSSVADLFGAADVFLALSEREGMPYSVLEAISSGTALVASDIPGHAAVARTCSACRLVERTPSSVAAAVNQLLERSPDATEADSRAAHLHVARDFSSSATAARTLDLLGRDLTESAS